MKHRYVLAVDEFRERVRGYFRSRGHEVDGVVGEPEGIAECRCLRCGVTLHAKARKGGGICAILILDRICCQGERTSVVGRA